MAKNLRKEKKSYGIKGLLFSALITALILITTCFIFSVICARNENPLAKTELYSLFSLIIGSLISSFICGRIFGFDKAALGALLITLLMILSGIIITSGRLSGSAFMNYGTMPGLSLLGAYFGKKREKRGHKHKIKKHAHH